MSTSVMPKVDNISHADLFLLLPLPRNHNESWINKSRNVNMDMPESDNTTIRHGGTDIDIVPGKIIYVTFLFLLNVFMLAGNSISIVTIVKTPFLRQRTYYWLVLNLAIVDLVNSLTVVPVNTVWELYGAWPFSQALCNIIKCADQAFSAIASYSTVLVSIDKYVYITKPFLYHSISAPCVAVISIISVWVVWVSISAAAVYGDYARNNDLNKTIYKNLDTCNFVMTDLYTILSALFTFFIPFFILLFTSIKILCVARKHICRIAANHDHVSRSKTTLHGRTSRRPTTCEPTAAQMSVWTTSSSANPSTSKDGREDRRPSRKGIHKATCRAFGTVMIVILFFIIMFAPYWFAEIVDVACDCIKPWVFKEYLSVFYYMHSLVNPYIYMLTDRRYKKALKMLCYKRKRKNSRSKMGSFSS